METLKMIFKELLSLFARYGVKILIGLLIIFVGFKLTSFLIKKLKKSRAFGKLDNSLVSFLCSLLNIAAKVVILITAAGVMGLPVTSFITMLASAGVAIGLALQGALSNLAGGAMLLLFRPFKVGDYIETADGSGTVHSITVFYTILKTPDNKKITLPNGTMTASAITNYSSEKERRVDIDLSVDYKTDVAAVKAMMMELMAKHPLVLQDPAPFCRLTAHGESALIITMRAWCKSENYWDVKLDLTEESKLALDRAGVSIPYPQLDIHVKNEKL